jgi:flagellar biosynthesis/type III secretory pathway protein FliH
MGAGAVLRRAVEGVEALPDDAEERIIALQHIERIKRIRAQREEAHMDGKQFVAETRAAHKAWTEKLEARAMKKGIKKGIEKGREEGREEGLRIAVTAFCEAAGIALDDARRAWIDGANAAQLDARLADLRATRGWA